MPPARRQSNSGSNSGSMPSKQHPNSGKLIFHASIVISSFKSSFWVIYNFAELDHNL